jgi:hypothetical protein
MKTAADAANVVMMPSSGRAVAGSPGTSKLRR